jgi:hypothetical protein
MLEALPAGTLGRTYADFVSREQLTADGLVDASEAERSRRNYGWERRLLQDRLRDSHDLMHVVTNYGRDLVGEAALLAFSFAQTLNPGVGFIVAVAWYKAGRGKVRGLIVDGFRRGRRAAWLPAFDWEAPCSRPLDDVRRELRIEVAPSYEAVRSAGAPPIESNGVVGSGGPSDAGRAAFTRGLTVAAALVAAWRRSASPGGRRRGATIPAVPRPPGGAAHRHAATRPRLRPTRRPDREARDDSAAA